MCFALSLRFEFEEKKRNVIVTTTLVIVLFTTIVFGGSTMPLLKVIDKMISLDDLISIDNHDFDMNFFFKFD